jgi:hypothetical protein
MKPVAGYAEEDWDKLMDLIRETVPIVGGRKTGRTSS